MVFYFFLFDNFETLDLFGPVEIFGRIPDTKLHYVSLEGGMITNAQGVRIFTDQADVLPKGGILVIPGGKGTRILVKDERFLSRLSRIADSAEYVLTVCTGSALLAAAGILHGVRATSNKYAFDWVISTGSADWKRKARWVHDGKYYTASGVSAGIDMALGFMADHYGTEAARENAMRAEYLWNEDADNDPFAVRETADTEDLVKGTDFAETI